MIACGALGREIVQLIERNRWRHLDVACLPAKLHHTPKKIPEAVREKIRSLRDRYKKIYVLYGDCGTGGLLDQVLREERNVERIAGPHCFSFYMGNEAFAAAAGDDLTTFFLTDYFACILKSSSGRLSAWTAAPIWCLSFSAIIASWSISPRRRTLIWRPGRGKRRGALALCMNTVFAVTAICSLSWRPSLWRNQDERYLSDR